MLSKKEAINNLKNVKLILGNGFYLHCGLKSSYSDFFESPTEKTKYDAIRNWLDNLVKKQSLSLSEIAIEIDDFFRDDKRFESTSVWDLFFAMDKNKNRMWCDVEKEISNSLFKVEDHGQHPVPIVSWKRVYQTTKEEKLDESNRRANILAKFCLKKNNGVPFEDLDSFYLFLLEQLRQFESEFGMYIVTQITVSNDFLTKYNRFYLPAAASTLESLCNLENLTSLDTFNFSPLNFLDNFDKIKDKIGYVNGNWKSPIFGIDSTLYPSKDIRHIFSKTYRRMELDMVEENTNPNPEFDNAIVYGHSLGENDYSYFFPLLDKLKMTDFGANGKIVFDFSIYDESKAISIRKSYREAIYRLFEQYAVFKGMGEDSGRLLDGLTTQGRVLLNEIEPIPNSDKTDYLSKY